MYISDEFVDREGLKVLFPHVSQSRIDDLWNVNIFGIPSQFSGCEVVDRTEAIRAGEIVFAEDRPKKKASDSEPETPQYSADDQKQLNISNDIIARFGNHKSEEDQYRVLCARKRIKKIEEKYNQPALDKKAIQAEIDEWEKKKAQLKAEADEFHKVHTPVPARMIDQIIHANRRISDLKKQLN